ncbi:ATP-binding protein [Streptomyces sp. NPDC086023]|uniref:ATP-binding protein n=1 Tax=Streptomyces sp. NPDC086023 TaxID=3365746 RepID=UPI0037D7CB50
MDRIHGGPEETGDAAQDRGADATGAVRHSLVKGSTKSGPARITRLVTGDFLLTVNPVDGSEIEARRPDAEAPARRKRDAKSRAAIRTAAQPPAPSGPPAPILPLLEREEERDRLVRLLSRGRSVRLTGPAGSGRSALLDAVADACADLAPDGVVRLSGHRQSPTDLLHALHAAVYDTTGHRPDRTELLARVREIGAVVLLDDLEFGGAALDELLGATPECAFLLAAVPDAPAPAEESHLEEVTLGGLGRTACAMLLAAAVGRSLSDEETAWAGDLWFASEGLPLRFVQAGALLRQRDELSGAAAPAPEDAGESDEEPGVFEERTRKIALPGLAESAAPAELLASRLGESARAALRFAVALGGEMPHQAHLPALVGDTHADTAVGELLACGLLSVTGSRYRLAPGVRRQLEEAGYADEAASYALTAAQHYAWWTGHPSVTPERAAAEADAVLAALAALVSSGARDGQQSAAVLLARTAAPAFAGGMHWSAWERVLRAGQEAARIAGEVAEEAYFHHELGILALCRGHLDRARAELEASIGLRGALADKRGTVAGRRSLALVADRDGGPVSPPLVLEAPAPAAAATPASEALTEVLRPMADAEPEPEVVKSAFPTLAPPRGDVAATPPVPLATVSPSGAPRPHQARRPAVRDARRAVLTGARRNVVAAAAGAVLVAVLGTAVTIGLTSNTEDDPAKRTRTEQSITGDDAEPGGPTEAADPDASADPQDPGTTPGTRTPGTTGEPTPGRTRSTDPTVSPSAPAPTATRKPTASRPPASSPAPTGPTRSPGPTGEPEPTRTVPTGPTATAPTGTTPTGGATSGTNNASSSGTTPGDVG